MFFGIKMISFNLCLVVVLVRKRKLYLNVRRDCNVYLHPETVYLHPKTVLISITDYETPNVLVYFGECCILSYNTVKGIPA